MSRAAGAIRSRVGVPLLFVAALASPAAAETPPEARAFLEHYHEDLGHLDRARDLLAAAAERQPDATVVTDIVELRLSASKPDRGIARIRQVTINQRGEQVMEQETTVFLKRRPVLVANLSARS